VIIFLETDEEVEIQVINLQSKHISRSFLDLKTFEENLQKYIKWRRKGIYVFPSTQLVSLVTEGDYRSYTRVSYFKYDQLREGKAKSFKLYTF